MSELRRLIRRELAAAYDNGAFAATNPVITTKTQLVDTGEGRILQAIQDQFTSQEAIDAGGRGMPRPTNVKRVIENVLGDLIRD